MQQNYRYTAHGRSAMGKAAGHSDLQNNGSRPPRLGSGHASTTSVFWASPRAFSCAAARLR